MKIFGVQIPYRIILLATVSLVVAFSLVYWGFTLGRGKVLSKGPELAPGELRLDLGNKELVIYEEGKPVKRVAVPRTGTRRITKKQSEDVQIERLSWMPEVVLLPQIGISLGRQLEPLVGIQWLRIRPLKVGLSLNITPQMVGIGIERDILSNCNLGLVYGLSYDNYTLWALKFALFL